jgi:hypothetical protein
MDSVTSPDFPEIFAEFREKQFALLWRGSRDGFGGLDFHSRCDGHPNTLTLILDTEGNIFGGFTPVEWEGESWDMRRPLRLGNDDMLYKPDPSLKSFLFSLKNPHNFPPRRFALKAEKQNVAIRRYFLPGRAIYGPHFHDIFLFNDCNASTANRTSGFGTCYANDTGLDGKTFFTGSEDFQVKEIEVFEIIA